MDIVSGTKDKQTIKTVNYRFVCDSLSYIKEYKKS